MTVTKTEICANCRHDRASHGTAGCRCGCAFFQSANSPVQFNSLKPGEEIQAEIERIRRLRAIKSESSD